jgi:uncharacterized protein
MGLISKLEMVQIASRVLVASSNTIETATKLLFPNLSIVKVNDTFHEPQYGTNMLERDNKKLEKMYQLGVRSYATHEKEIVKTVIDA